MIVKILAILMAINVYLPYTDTKDCETANLRDTEWYVGYGGYKCYMDYRTITDTSSPQWNIQQQAYTDKNGIRKIKDRYCIALGSAYGNTIGDKYIVELNSGEQLKCTLADQKADCDTNAEHTADMNGAVLEFIVDVNYLPSNVKKMGDVSYISGMKGEVKKIYKEVNKWRI